MYNINLEMEKSENLINIYPYLLVYDNITDDIFDRYKRWVHEIEYEDMSYNSGMTEYYIETISMEEIFEVAKFLSEEGIRWKFYNKSNCGWVNYGVIDRESIHKKEFIYNDHTFEILANYRIQVNIPMKIHNYSKFVKSMIKMCSKNKFKVSVLKNFPSSYTSRYRRIANNFNFLKKIN